MSNGGHVVAEGVDGSIGCPFLEGYHLQLHEDGGLFHVAVGEGARGLFSVTRAPWISSRKGTPDVSLVLAVKEHPAHATLGSIGGAQEQGALRDEFGLGGLDGSRG